MTVLEAPTLPPLRENGAKRSVHGRLVKVLLHRRDDRGMALEPHAARCVRAGEVHELVTTDHDDTTPGARIDRVGFLGFVELGNAGVIDRGDTVRIGGRTVGTVLGFDACHFPNHYNILIHAPVPLTGADLGLVPELTVTFEPLAAVPSLLPTTPEHTMPVLDPVGSAPDLAQAMVSVTELADTGLPKETVALAELLRLHVSQRNGCGYCTTLHRDAALAAGQDPAKLDALAGWPNAAHFSAEERAALAVADHLTREDSGPIPDALRADAARHFEPSVLARLVWTIAATNAWNRIGLASAAG
ncbi:carboxymuconolactone decarboxylase family protein [Streptacidiphilus fuscans]|uniref:Carboxymuconolactone decarboxylase family protein n=1 Tax=Streptacidiphilus fuscans TaxID=2789292 RepID=A0A931B5I2_9ACTN|nr:carboxymuconolactone decarboxylase family protein [Streptacidiphilus fuscans]MBF9069802.1 carboxymuconolactone decarboxylase family protein [Streptacidiphilus fuscans]